MASLDYLLGNIAPWVLLLLIAAKTLGHAAKLHTPWNIFHVTNIRFSSSLFSSGFTYGCWQDTIFDPGKSVAKKKIRPPF